MKRRYFLMGGVTLALSQIVASCGDAPSQTLKVRLLKDSIPAQLLNEFRRFLKQPATLDFAPEGQLKDLFVALQTWQQPVKTEGSKWLSLPFLKPKAPNIPDLVTLGDYWLAAAIQQKLIQPLELDRLHEWQQLSPRWQQLVKRNDQGEIDDQGKIWGAPYRWGSTVIVYRRDKFKALGWTPTDWSDLWRPELRDRISLLDQPRQTIGLTLKHLGHSYNTQQLDKIPDLKNTLRQLHQQVKFYSSDTYLQPLLLQDTWLAVGWSTDVLPLLKSNQEIAAIIPQSGTAIWADLWVQPTSPDPNQGKVTLPIVEDWINFCWQSNPASQITLFSDAASPVINRINPGNLSKEVRENRLILPETQVFDRSEFLYPLTQLATEEYHSLWENVIRS